MQDGFYLVKGRGTGTKRFIEAKAGQVRFLFGEIWCSPFQLTEVYDVIKGF